MDVELEFLITPPSVIARLQRQHVIKEKLPPTLLPVDFFGGKS